MDGAGTQLNLLVLDACRNTPLANRGLRDELVDGEIFRSLREAQIAIESWRHHYNAVRPHACIGYQAPAPEMFVPALAALPAAQPRPVPLAMLPLAPRPTLN
jgi:transposase InsO family protein